MLLEPTCNAAVLFFRLWGPVNFFLKADDVDQTVDRLRTRVEFTETGDLSKKSAGRADNETWPRWRFSKT